MRRPLVAGNWKMNKTVPEALALAKEIRAGLGDAPLNVDVVMAPPFTALHAVGQQLQGSAIALAAQNMHWEKDGAFTGEISARMLRDAGCRYVILGHSERRQLFGATDEGASRKARAAFESGIAPLICVGETLSERDARRTLEVIERQIERTLRALTPDEVAVSVVAYEPVWAIGTGQAATPAEAQQVHAFIRKQVRVSHGDPAAAALRVLYGGSVSPANIKSLMDEPDIDGALVGGACLKAESFLQIVRFGAA